MIRKPLVILFFAAMLLSCQSKKNNFPGSSLNLFDSLELAADMQLSEEANKEIVQNVSSPIEMAALIKEIGMPFSLDYLATTDYIDRYNTSYRIALMLGVFGADLGYLNIYEKNTRVIEYLSSINKLAEGIRVGQFFDFVTLKRLATSRENMDSLKYLSVNTFNQIDSYLRENQRGQLSGLMIAGTWIEGMYLATQVARENTERALYDRIGEQKLNLNNIFLLLNPYQSQEQIREILDVLQGIKDEFDDVEISYEMGEPERIEKDGMVMVVQNEKSVVHITDEQMRNIIRKTEEVRNKLIEK